jgi:tRNA 5-methylaminomethyl-2-thiouridine biosynthesis bifunctional protein
VKTAPIIADALERDATGTPFSPRFGDVYHPATGALPQARHVFLAGNGLPGRWRGRERFTLLETGFGLGNNFLATWDAWKEDPQRCERLVFISVERHPLQQDDLSAVHRGSPLQSLAHELAEHWPPLTHNLHRLAFEDGRVQLLLALGDVAAWLPELVASVDAFYLDGFAPACNPEMWQPRVCKALARLAAPEATLATWSASRSVRDGLAAAGFSARLAPGQGGKRDITLARYAPAFTPRRAPARSAQRSGKRHALIIGAGLAGCAAAWALAEQGWTSRLIDRHPSIASEASGNPAGLFHGVVHPQDGTHARLLRAAALEVVQAVRRAIDAHGVEGAIDGLLRRETSGANVEVMRATLARLGLPTAYVQALDAVQAAACSGLPLAQPAWFYPSGGWVQPAGLARSFIERAGASTRFSGEVEVDALQPCDSGRWRLLDREGRSIDEAGCVVLAAAADATRLAGAALGPLQRVRGQISSLPLDAFDPPLTPPRLPIAGSGYVLPALSGRLVFGATSQVDSDDAAVRADDHAHNLAQLSDLMGRPFSVDAARFEGRTGWRVLAADRLPLVGAVPDLDAARTAKRLDQARFVPRRPGLFVFSALGSRGIAWSALGGRLLASLISGAPCPLESSLIDAVDPARFVTRAARRASSGQ